jgi:hypothetical protein
LGAALSGNYLLVTLAQSVVQGSASEAVLRADVRPQLQELLQYLHLREVHRRESSGKGHKA